MKKSYGGLTQQRTKGGISMRARITEYNNESGKVIKKGFVNYHYAESLETANTPIIQVSLPDKSKTIAVCVDIPLRQLLNYVKNKEIPEKKSLMR